MNELMTRESGQMAALFRMLEHALDHIELLAENYRPVLGGERYLTDREVAKLLKTCRRTLQEYRDAGRMSYIQLGGKILYRVWVRKTPDNHLIIRGFCFYRAY